MFDKFFGFMMKLLLVVVIAGLIASSIWKLAALIAILLILSPFATIIYIKVVRSIKESEKGA